MTAGTRVGPYEVLNLLGAGGMGEVYRARDTKLGREVAIKILPQAWSADPDRVARFAREAHLLAAVNHPNIAAIYGLEESGPTVALVLELVAGETMSDRLRAGAVPIPEAIAIARQIADALDAAHERGIVHRDLKPANIIVTAEGRVKVLDFGLAKAAETAPADLTNSPTMIDPTVHGMLLGTALYMSPEQTRGKAVDKRADIWAFGCVLYEMLAGRRAFAGETASDIIAAILGSEPDWSAVSPATPARVGHLLRRCLEKDRRRRLRDIGDALTDLGDEVLRPPAADEDASRRGRRSRAPLLVAAGAVVLVAISLLWLYFRRDASPHWENPLANATFQRLTDFEGSELDAALSPDGRFFVFVANREGPFDAWVGQIGSGELVNVTKGQVPDLMNDEIRSVGFSSDGQIWMRAQQRPVDSAAVTVFGRTVVVPVIGGTIRQLLNAGIEPVWSRDGSRMAYHEAGPGDPIFVADRNGRDAKRIFAPPRGIHCHYLAWSPDGRFIYFVSGIPPNEMDIWRVPSAGGSAERITNRVTNIAYPTPIDDRTLLYRGLDDDGSGPWLYAMDLTRRTTHRISLGVEQYLSIAASADGRRLLATVSNPSGGLWTVPVTSGIAAEQTAEPVSLPSVTAISPRYGRDYLLYLSSQGGPRSLWRFKDGAAMELWKAAEGGLTTPPAVSPDGRQIAFSARRGGSSRLSVMDQDGTNLRPLIEGVEVRDPVSWSPDGKSIVAAAGDRLIKIAVDGGVSETLLSAPGRLPIWSPDGRYILYSEAVQGPGYPVKAITPDGKPFPIPVLWIRRGVDWYRVLPGGREILFLSGDYGSQNFWLLDIVRGTRRQITQLKPGFSIRGFDLSRDGTRIVFDRVRENSDVVLIDLPRP
jgi:Tol biopolymer transport system component